jgi:hypothetical protein
MGTYMTNIIEPTTKFTPSIDTNLEPQIDWAHAAVILGRDRQTVKELGLKGTMSLGVVCEHQGVGASLFGYKIMFDNNFPHIIFICGKRGSGKSYTLGVMVEELGRSNTGIGTVVVDPLGTFWTMNNKNKSKKAANALAKYGLYPKDFNNIKVLAPVGFYEDMKNSVDGAFSVAVSDLTVDDWCLVFDIDRFKTQGLLIGDVIDKINRGYDAKIGDVTKRIKAKKKGYTIGDIVFCIQNDVNINSTHEGYALATRRSVIARFRSAAKWGIFSVKGTPINQISKRNQVTILDVSHSKLGSSRRALIVGIVSRKILEARIESSRKEEASSMGKGGISKEIIPVTWLIIDEAHLLLPSSGSTPATEALIEYAKLGRKPGCGLVFATQRPASTNDEILSQVDTIIGHNLALEDDIAALRRRIPTKMPEEFNNSDFIRGLPVGVCLVADQKTQKRAMLVQIRPRMTHHSGKAAVPKPEVIEEQPVGELEKEQLTKEIKTIETEAKVSTEFSGIEDIMKPSADISGLTGGADLNRDLDSDEVDKGKDTTDITGIDGEAIKQAVVGTTKFDMQWGGAYIILTKGNEFSTNIFANISQKYPEKCLSITRMHPSKLSPKLEDEGMRKYWLSKSTEDSSIPPGNITNLAHVINEHIKANDNSIILLDGLEYLINNNDFPKVLQFTEAIHEKIVLNNAILLIPINPSTISKGDLDLLENELLNTISDPELKVADKSESTDEAQFKPKGLEDIGGDLKQIKDDALIEPSKLDKSETDKTAKIRPPTKAELKSLCSKLGLKTSGTVAELKGRLLAHEEVSSVPEPISDAKDKGKAEVRGKIKEPTSKPSSKEVETGTGLEKITKNEEEIIKSLERERLALLAEKKKLQDNLTKLIEDQLNRKLEKEKQRLADAEKRLKREKILFEEKKKTLGKDKKILKPPMDGKVRKQMISGKPRSLEKPLDTPPGLKTQPKQRQKVKAKPELVPRKTALKNVKIDSIKKYARPLDKTLKVKPTPKVKPLTSSKPPAEPGKLVIKATLKGKAVSDFAIKHLKTTMFGKPLEAINEIRPVYLPLLRIYIKTMRGSIFAKEYDGTFFWDLVTGEIITDFDKVLKRSKGVATLIQLSPNQARVLAAMDTWGSNDIIELQGEVSLPVPELKRALTALGKKSLVAQEYHPDKNLYNYKRKVELKFPKKLDKIKVDMPRIVESSAIKEVIQSRFKLSELEKLVKNLIPGTRIISTQEIFYPYFELNILGRGGQRTILMDAVTGDNDKLLTSTMQYL